MNSVQVQRDLLQQWRIIGLPASRAQLATLALLCHGLAVSPNCHLATLALGAPAPGVRPSLEQRLTRLVKNEHLQPGPCYGAVVRHLLAHWDGREVVLVLDRTDIRDRWSILLLGAAFQKRLLPLAWDVLPFGATSAARQIALLARVQPALPPLDAGRIYLYGDSEFRAVALQRQARAYGWHWQVGLACDTLFQTRDGRWQALRSLQPTPNQRWYRQGVHLTEQAFGPVNLLAAWVAAHEAPRYWALDLPANKQAWRRGRKRFWVEPFFRDWKSYGFDVERSQLDEARRLDVLLLGLALTTVWLLHVGNWLTRHGRRPWLEAAHRQNYSLFRLGRDHLQRARTIHARVPVGFTVSHR